MIKKGDQVWIKSEWQDEGDSDHRWFAVEDAEHGHSLRIQCEAFKDWAIAPIHTVTLNMLVGQ